ncbi:hypothetical protein YZ31_07085 [Campylobacter lari]|nr:hypothetical protein [Campylobacter lari]
MLLVFYYFIEYLEKHNINENNIDKNLFLKLLSNFNLSKDNTNAIHCFILKEKDKRNLIEWVEKEMQEFEIKVLVAMLKDEIKTLIKKELHHFHLKIFQKNFKIKRRKNTKKALVNI